MKPRIWHVVFVPTDYKHLLSRWINPQFGHVYAMSQCGGIWDIVECHKSHLAIRHELVDEYPHPRLYAGPKAVIVPVEAVIDENRFRGTICLFNCVEVVKALLGIKRFSIFTPYQFYKYLMRQGNG